MLPAAHRLADPDLFRSASRRGRRSGSTTLVTHVLADSVGEHSVLPGDLSARSEPALVGFVVSKAVGGAVVRNRVKRRLRHLMRARVAELPAGAVLVVRANPAAAEASYSRLGRDLDKCLRRSLERPDGDQGRS